MILQGARAGMVLQRGTKLRQGGQAFIFPHWPVTGYRLPSGTGPCLGGGSHLWRRTISREGSNCKTSVASIPSWEDGP